METVITERHGAILLVQMNRPERMNALGVQLRTELAEAFTELRDDPDLEVGVFTGTGRAFCAGEDMKESIRAGAPGLGGTVPDNPFMDGSLDKPVIAAINGYAMGDRSDLMESRKAFAEKRAPRFKGWIDPADRYRMPTVESVTEPSQEPQDD